MMDVNTTYLMNGGIEDRINRIHEDWGTTRPRRRRRGRIPQSLRARGGETAD